MIKAYRGTDLTIDVPILKDDNTLYTIPTIAGGTPANGEVINIYALVRSDYKLMATYSYNPNPNVPDANILTAIAGQTKIGIAFKKEVTKNWTEGTLSIEVVFDLYNTSFDENVSRGTYLQKNLGYILNSSAIYLS